MPSPQTSPLQGHLHDSPEQSVEGHFPQGRCRFILTVPGVQGHRCGCTAFHLKQAMPGAMCDCGHLSCFHLDSADAPSPGRNQEDITMLKQRLRVLEQKPPADEHAALERLVDRVGTLEESLEKSTEIFQDELKASYRHISAAWNLVERLQQQVAILEKTRYDQSEQLSKAGKELQELRNRHLELLDNEEILEERIERLEHIEMPPSPKEEYHPGSPRLICASSLADSEEPRRLCPSVGGSALLSNILPTKTQPTPSHSESIAHRLCLGSPRTWTVHVSVLPDTAQQYPYPKDTQEYKRCLSRGLHQMVAVEGSSGVAFKSAVRDVFRHILKDNPWLPFRVANGDQERKRGLPRLRPLDGPLIEEELSHEFLHRYCATHDTNGDIESLYVAVVPDGLPWAFVKDLAVFTPGLESSWAWNERLDGPRDDQLSRTDQGSLSPAPSSTSKRAATEMLSISGGQERCDQGSHRAKMARFHLNDLSELRREAEDMGRVTEDELSAWIINGFKLL